MALICQLTQYLNTTIWEELLLFPIMSCATFLFLSCSNRHVKNKIFNKFIKNEGINFNVLT